ncbi:MAG TPA: polysaccharide deacetylase family protein [Vicinamibacterales bacterium]|nr:polysaccharide deacetylase family protein [Vicinamibacterales bacterium]
MIRTVKQTALSTMRTAGVFDMASRSRWRSGRLLILGYHGISQEDEHHWNPSLFIPPEHLASRLRFLRAGRFNILPFGEAMARLNAGTLPDRSVTLTFDDGYVDFYRLALPILRAYDAPATVYLTTYYAEKARPVPGITAAYMIWKSRHFRGALTTVPGFEGWRLHTPLQRRIVSEAVGRYFTEERSISPDDKHRMLEALAAELGFNLEAFRRRRLMHVMTPDEAREVAQAGIDIQLHTHRHWVPKDEALIRREIQENRERIEAITGRPANDFCYPSGIHYPEMLPWLRRLGVRSATTCEPGLACPGDEPLLLHRFLDHSGVSLVEFEAWASGVGSVLPRRPAYELAVR